MTGFRILLGSVIMVFAIWIWGSFSMVKEPHVLPKKFPDRKFNPLSTYYM